MKRKLVAMCLALMMTITSLPQQIYAKTNRDTETETVEEEIELEEETEEKFTARGELEGLLAAGDLLSEDTIELASDSVEYDHANDARIVASLENLENTVDVTGFGLTTENVGEIVSSIINLNPQLFYLGNGWKYAYNGNNEVTTLNFEFTDSVATIQTKKQQVKEALQEALDAVDTSGMKPEEIALFYHDYLAGSIEYAKDELIAGNIQPQRYNVYGALVEKKAVCQGYAMAFMYLMQQFDIPCGYATSDKINHGWNVVKIGNEWYHLDVTFDDPTYDCIGRVSHEYFLVSSARIREWEGDDRTNCVVQVETDTTYEEPTATNFETGFWTQSNSLMYYYKNYWYYANKEEFEIVKYRYGSNLGTALLKDASCKWLNIGQSGSYWLGNHGRLAGSCNMLYYSTPEEIYSLDLNNVSNTECIYIASTGSMYIYGLAIRNGYLYYGMNEDPNSKSAELVLETGVMAQQHTWLSPTKKDPTCMKDGANIEKCSKCGKSHTTLISATKNISDCSITLSYQTIQYDGVAKKPLVTVKDGDILVPSGAYKVTYQDNTEVGKAKISVSGVNGYTGSLETEFEITEPPHVHSWDGGTVTTQPTCEKTGVKTYTCTDEKCNETKTEPVAATGHTVVVDVAVEATCTSVGTTAGSHCSVCGKILEAQTQIPMKAHTWTLVEEVLPSCTKAGERTEQCSVCQEIKETELPATKDITGCKLTLDETRFPYDGNQKKPSVTLYDGDVLIDTAYYTISYQNNVEIGTAKVIVSGKGGYTGSVESDFTIFDNSHEAQWDAGVVSAEPTCTKDGEMLYHCTVEGCTDTKTEPILALGHTEVADDAVEATCTSVGKTAGSHCSVCGETIVAQTDIPMKEHTWVFKEEILPSCTAVGKHVEQCSVCQKIEETEIPMEEHIWEETERVEPSCMCDGRIVYTCETCNGTDTQPIEKTLDITDCRLIVSKEYYNYNGTPREPSVTVKDGRITVPEDGYEVTYEDNIEIGMAKAIVTGVAPYTGSIEVEFEILDPNHDHEWDEGVTMSSPTCTEAGQIVYHCIYEGCEETVTELIKPNGHVEMTDKARKPTCSLEGRRQGSHCKVCGIVLKKQEIIEKLPHDYHSTLKEKATPERNGSIVNKCSVCGAEDKEYETIISRPKKMTLSVTNYIYNGKSRKPSVRITDGNGNVIPAECYTVEYSGGCKNVGGYQVKATLSGNYDGTMIQTFRILPKGTKITKASAKSKGISLKWKKQNKQIDGYEIQYDTNKKFKKAKKAKIGKVSQTSKSITKLKAKKTYYVRIRTYKKVKIGGKKVTLYSTWSSAKKVNTKK